MKKFVFLIGSLYFFVPVTAQQSLIPPAIDSAAIPVSSRQPNLSFTKNNDRQWLVGSASVAIYAGSLIALNEAWYKQYPKSSFHFLNDDGEWLQIDKFGHGWTAYNMGRATTAAWQWAGLPEKKAVWIGSLSGFSYMTVIEFLDGHSAKWGWSWGDMAANFTGAASFASQQLTWKEQRIQYKFSTHRVTYAPDLQKRANDLFGKNLEERLLKDYNAQTYWFSFNIHSFLPQNNMPEWLNIAVGYGAEGMFGGYKNIAYDKNGNIIFNRTDIKRYRQWYIAPDLDFTKIKTNSKAVRTLLTALNALKLPTPALEFSKGKLKGHWLMF